MWTITDGSQGMISQANGLAQFLAKDFIQKKVISAQLSKQYPKQFIPRYNMVSFTSIPYSEVYKRGNIQEEIISKLDINNPDFNSAKDMIHKQLTPIS